jgi:Flp pilus assembly pilin Flp
VHRRTETGASAVEFAVAVPLLVALLVAIITAGLLFMKSVALSDSVRAGGRFGGTVVSDSSWPGKVQARTVEYSAGTLTAAQVCVQLARGSGPVWTECSLTGTLATPPPSPSGLLATECVVKVWAAQPAQLSAPPFYDQTITLNRKSVTRYERGTC